MRRPSPPRCPWLRSPLLRGFAELSLVILGFAGFGLGWAAVEGVGLADTPYPRASMEREAGDPDLWLVDGFNVLHAGILGGRERSRWWTGPRRAELLARAAGFDDPSARVWVVFDGSRTDGEREEAPGLHSVFAPSADAWLLERVRELQEIQGGQEQGDQDQGGPDQGNPEAGGGGARTRVVVVTADRQLAERARHRGARVVSPRAFLERCRPGPEPPGVATG